MIHDIFLIMGGRDPKDVKLDRIDKYLCLSHRHAKFVSDHHGIPMDKILVTSNGLDLNRFSDRSIKRDPYKLIYSSSPDRGLERLLDFFPELDDRATLHVYYGFENFKDQDYVSRVKNRMESFNKGGKKRIFYHGRIGQEQLAKEFMSSSIWAYPTWFEETFCITALEAMAGGAVTLSSHYWGLIDTVKDGGILIDLKDNRNSVFNPDYTEKWIFECNRLLSDLKYQEEWRNKGFERVKKFSWSAVAEQWHHLFQKGEWEEIQ
jgi:glycosyltransferase involved in cell wall biosynthesis